MGVKWILLWNPSPGPEGAAATAAAAGGAGGGAEGDAGFPKQHQKTSTSAPPPPPPFSGRAAFDAVAAAVARVCGPPLPGPPWRADVTLLRSSSAASASATGGVSNNASSKGGATTTAANPSDLVAVSFASDDPSSLHLVCDSGRNVLTADALSSGPLVVACGGYQPRARLHLSGPRFAAGGFGFGDAGAVVARVAPRPGDPPRAVAVVVSLESASDVAEAAPALREFAEALRGSVRKLAEEADEAARAAAAAAAASSSAAAAAGAGGGDDERRRRQLLPPPLSSSSFPRGTLEPLAAPLAEFALPRAPQGPQHFAVQVAALFSAVLSRPRGQ